MKNGLIDKIYEGVIPTIVKSVIDRRIFFRNLSTELIQDSCGYTCCQESSDALKKIGDLYQITIYERYNEEYTTFCTPECRNAIDDYLEFRSRSGEKITAGSYLIRQEFDINDQEQIRKHSKPIASSTIRDVIWRNMVKAGIRDINHSGDKHYRKTIPEIHGFRKFFSTQLVNAGLNTEKRWLLEGHRCIAGTHVGKSNIGYS